MEGHGSRVFLGVMDRESIEEYTHRALELRAYREIESLLQARGLERESSRATAKSIVNREIDEHGVRVDVVNTYLQHATRLPWMLNFQAFFQDRDVEAVGFIRTKGPLDEIPGNRRFPQSVFSMFVSSDGSTLTEYNLDGFASLSLREFDHESADDLGVEYFRW